MTILTEHNGKSLSRRLILIQDILLTVGATLLSVLLVRWLSDPIQGFSKLVYQLTLASSVLSLIAFYASGSFRTVSGYTSLRSFVRIFWAVLIKDAGIIIFILTGFVSFPSGVYSMIAILSDFILSLGMLIGARLMAMELIREAAKVQVNASKGTALVAGTSPESVALAYQTEISGLYTVVGFFSSDRSQSGLVIGSRIVYHCSSPDDLKRLQWKLGGVDALLFPKGNLIDRTQF